MSVSGVLRAAFDLIGSQRWRGGRPSHTSPIPQAGEFHTDPHPGNVVLLRDGRVGLLDWGQTKVLPPDKVDSCAECVVCMARGDAEGLARTIEASGIAELENPSVALWALISYTYFDTRWTPLAGVNLYDVDRSLLARDGFRRNSPVEACVEINVASMAWGVEV